jgi:hypothetical protein
MNAKVDLFDLLLVSFVSLCKILNAIVVTEATIIVGRSRLYYLSSKNSGRKMLLKHCQNLAGLSEWI